MAEGAPFLDVLVKRLVADPSPATGGDVADEVGLALNLLDVLAENRVRDWVRLTGLRLLGVEVDDACPGLPAFDSLISDMSCFLKSTSHAINTGLKEKAPETATSQ